MARPGSSIARVEAWALGFPLASPLQFGDLRIVRRDYVVVQLTTGDGVRGLAYALSRGAPVDLVVTELLGPLLNDQDAPDTPAPLGGCRGAMSPPGWTGLVQGGLSRVDTALGDIKAGSAHLPLWRLLGGYRDETPIMLVDGYARQDESAVHFAQRLGTRAQDGFTAIKLANQAGPQEMSARLTAVREAVGPRVP